RRCCVRAGLRRGNRDRRAQRQPPPRRLVRAGSILAEDTGDGPRRRHIGRRTAQARAYSQAVITEGGRIVWLAGQVGAADASGNSLAGDFDGQVREVFARLSQTLEEDGGSLADMVTMTVFITDARYGDRFTELRK